MTLIEENQPLFLDSQHLLVAVVATIAAQHGVEKTRELVDELADNDATWAAIAQKVEAVEPSDNAGDVAGDAVETTEPSALPELTEASADPAGALLNGDDIESAGPDGVAPLEPGDAGDEPPQAPTENGALHL